LSKSNLSQANYLAFGDWFIGQAGPQFAQIIVIEKSDHAPGTHKINKFTSRRAPEEKISAGRYIKSPSAIQNVR